MPELIYPGERRSQRRFVRHIHARKEGEVSAAVYDVYRILKGTSGKVIEHIRVYTNYTDFNAALAASNELQRKTKDRCYVVGRKTRRLKRGGKP